MIGMNTLVTLRLPEPTVPEVTGVRQILSGSRADGIAAGT